MRLPIILALMLTFLSAEPREALLIGNNNYQHISNLDDPSANLTRLKKSLKSVGFTNVTIETNLNSENLENAIDNFVARLAKNSNAIGFLYYTGHGCQVDYQGYLVPTNVDTKKKLNIKYSALNINKLLEKFLGAGNRVNMLFLDACRDVPTGAKGGTKGLGQPLAKPKGSLVVYATEAGKVANDNSRFINALISNIKQPNLTIRDMADNISSVVAQQSSYTQVPEVFSKLLPKVVLNRKVAYVVPPKPVVIQPQSHSTTEIVQTVVTPRPVLIPQTSSSLLNGLVAHYKFEGNARDSSGNGNHGIKYGGIGYTNGVIGKAGSFDGNNYLKYATIDKHTVSDLTISMFIKIDSNYINSNVGSTLISNYKNSDNYDGLMQYGIRVNNEKVSFFYDYGDSFEGIESKISNKSWLHIVALINSSTRTSNLFINNKLVSVGTPTGKLLRPHSSFLFIGGNTSHTESNFKGLIDDLRIYNRALSESEITELYNMRR